MHSLPDGQRPTNGVEGDAEGLAAERRVLRSVAQQPRKNI
jgi:hypothetical protein